MPSSSSRAFSPPTSTVSLAGNSSPIQIKKVVIEGRSKNDGASLKMFFKLSVAVDSVSPGTSIPLFREDNIRITQSKVHPLDDRSVPYYYSSTEQPLLHKAAVALQLGTKSSRPYSTLFPMSSPPMDPINTHSSRRSRDSTTSTSTAAPSDERYTGFILVSGYNVTLVLPKEFPPRPHSTPVGAESDGEDGFIKEMPSSWSTRSVRHPPSMFPKAYLHMMAALEVLIPYVTIPPKGPFLISIPVPRCLDNHIKLRISTPPINLTPTSFPQGSFVSTSSEDDMPGWDFLTEPPVSRKVDKSLRKSPYQQSADDENSESHNGSSIPGTELIQGAYQSTDVLHVRWAPPAGKRSSIPKTEDGMRRVGIERTVGNMRCEVLGRDAQGVKLGITYHGVCTGLWHPGVATMLGMDIALDIKGRRVSWPFDGIAGWSISGGNGYGGLYSEASSSRRPSFESSSSTPFLHALAARAATNNPSRPTASLLRAPLPNQPTPEYSFETSPGTTPPPATPSSGPSSAYLSPGTPGQESRLSRSDVSPGKAVTLKVNLLKLLPPAKNAFEFSVKGVVIVDVEEEDFVPLPMFHVLGSDKEKVDTVLALLATDAIIQVGTRATDGIRRTLQLGEEVRCDDNVGLVLEPQPSQSALLSSSSMSSTPAKNRTPSRAVRAHSPRVQMESSELSEPQPQDLPCVFSTVTPLPRSLRHTHCVHVNILAYSLDADVIEFGLALPRRTVAPVSATLAVEVLYAMYGGRYVRAEVLPRPADAPHPTLFSGLDTLGESEIVGEMQFWIVVHLEDVQADVGDVDVVYLVGEGEKEAQSEKAKGKAKEEVVVDVLLPCFQQSVSRYQVEIDCPAKFDPQIRHSTLQQYTTPSNALKFTHFALPTGFFPVLSLSLLPSTEPAAKRSRTRRAAGVAFRTLPSIVAITLLYLVVSIGSEVRQVRETINAAARVLVGGVPYPDAYWGNGAYSEKPWWWPEDHFMAPVRAEVTPTTTTATTTTASITTVTSWEKETVIPATPTVNLAEATPVREKGPSRPVQTRNNRAGIALYPLPAVPLLSWQIPPETKELVFKGLRRILYLLRRIIDFPLDPV